MVALEIPNAPEPAADLPLIPQFYAGRSLLITGGTGFMGKVLVERILYTCPQVGLLHLLMRSKKDQPPHKRLMELKQSPVFDVVRRECPAQLDKLRVVSGDTAVPGLGLSPAALADISEVSLVFHSAATVRFDEELKKATEENVRSVLRLMDICDSLPKMVAFIHVSTGYANADLSEVAERVYQPPMRPEQLFALVDSLPAETLATIVPHLLGRKPNTYTFTKAIAETAVNERKTTYARAIFRPTIVVSSLRTPFPGWVENFNGPAGLVVAAGKGLLHTFILDFNLKADLLPVDIAIDTMIAVGWHISLQRPAEAVVYNCSTSTNPTSWWEFYLNLKKYYHEVPFDDLFWFPSGTATTNVYLNKFREVLYQTLPLHVAEYASQLFGIKKKMNFITVSRKLTMLTEILSWFSMREWYFQDGHVAALRASLAPEDARVFNLDPKSIVWEDHVRNFIYGTRKYLLLEKDHDLKKAKQQYNRLWVIHTGAKWLIFALAFRLLLKNSEIMRQVFYGTLKLLLSLFHNAYRQVTHTQEL